MKRSSWLLLLLVSILQANAFGQERLIIQRRDDLPNVVRALGFFEVDLTPGRFGRPTQILDLPRHAANHDLVAIAGGRYVTWTIYDYRGPASSLPKSEVALLDLRTGQAMATGIRLDGPILLADPLRPRVFARDLDRLIVIDIPSLHVRAIELGPGVAYRAAYAPDAGVLFFPRRVPSDPDPLAYREVAALDVASGIMTQALSTTPWSIQALAVNRAASRLYVGGDAFRGPGGIRAYDLQTGRIVAERTGLWIGSGRGQAGEGNSASLPGFVLDEARDRLITWLWHPSTASRPTFDSLAAFSSTTLTPTGELSMPNPRAHVESFYFRPNSASLYILRSASNAQTCMWATATSFDLESGALKELANLAGLWPAGPASTLPPCSTPAVLLTAPGAPAALCGTVTGARLSLTWQTSRDTTHYLVEAGSAPSRADLAQLLTAESPLIVDNVPPGRYFVRVHAINEIGRSAASNEIEVIVP